MSTIHTLYRCGKITSCASPNSYNLDFLNAEKHGNKEKTYTISKKASTVIKSSLVRQWNEHKHRITFWTFTFKNTPETRSVVHDQRLMNQFFSKVLENTKKTFGLNSYLWVSERTEKHGIHYHCTFDIPYLPKETKKDKFYKYVDYFKNSFSDFLRNNGVIVDNSVQYCSIGFGSKFDKYGNRRGSVVRSLGAISAYIGNYISKSTRIERGGRIYGISRNILEKSVRITFPPTFILEKSKYEHEYCTIRYYNCDAIFDNFFRRCKKIECKSLESDLKKSVKIAKNVVNFKNLQTIPTSLQQIINKNTVDHCEKVSLIKTISDEMAEIDREREIIAYNWQNFRSVDIGFCPF